MSFIYNVNKEVRSSQIMSYMAELQYFYYKISSKNEFAKYPEVRKSIEDTLRIYDRCIENYDYNFKKIKIAKKWFSGSNLLINKEVQDVLELNGDIKYSLYLNDKIQEELFLLKKTIRGFKLKNNDVKYEYIIKYLQ